MFDRIAVVALVCAACTVNADFGSSTFRCSDGVCPDGFSCVGGMCVVPDDPDAGSTVDAPPGAPDAPVADAGTPDAAPPAVTCGSPLVITEDFEDPDLGEMWSYSFSSAPATRSVTGGRGVLTMAENTAGSHYVGFATQWWFDLRGSRAYVEIPEMVNPATSAEAFFILARSSDDRVLFNQQGGNLVARVRTGGVNTEVGSGTYDPIAHRWWQIREQDGSVYFETSPDGSGWNVFAEAPAPPYLATVRPQITAGTWEAVVGPGALHVDNFNGGGAPQASWCKAGSVSDDFEDGQTGMLWDRSWSSACTRAEVGGQIVFSPAPGSSNYCGNNTGTLFDLTESEVTIELVQPTAQVTGPVTYFKVEIDSDNFVGFAVEGLDRLNTRYGVLGDWTTIDDRQFDPVAHHFWRLRHGGTTVYWDVSPDGTTWNNLGSAPAAIDLTAVQVVIGAGVSGTATEDPGDARFDNYNRIP